MWSSFTNKINFISPVTHKFQLIMESYSKISLNLSERQFHDPSMEDSCQKGFQLSYNQLPKDEAKARLRLSHFYFFFLILFDICFKTIQSPGFET